MATIQVRAKHYGSDDAYADVQMVSRPECAGEIIHPSTAVAIASWWQSPSGVGWALAGFASGAEVDSDDVLADIEATQRTEVMDERDAQALSLLTVFVRAWQLD